MGTTCEGDLGQSGLHAKEPALAGEATLGSWRPGDAEPATESPSTRPFQIQVRAVDRFSVRLIHAATSRLPSACCGGSMLFQSALIVSSCWRCAPARCVGWVRCVVVAMTASARQVSNGNASTMQFVELCRSVFDTHALVELIGVGESVHTAVTLSELLLDDATRVSIHTSTVRPCRTCQQHLGVVSSRRFGG